MNTTAEFAVQISCDSCVKNIENSLKDVPGVKTVTISKEKNIVLVESNLSSTVIQEKIESTGRKAVLKGYGSEKGAKEVFNFVKVEIDSSGRCGICSPDERAATLSKAGEDESSENPTTKNPTFKNSKPEARSDDEEELELKYDSDSDNNDSESHINALNKSGEEDIWKIEDDLVQDFDVIDADGDISLTEDKAGDKEDFDRDEENEDLTKKRKSSPEASEENQTTKKKGVDVVKKFVESLKAAKMRKGNINLFNYHIAFHVLIIPEKKGEHLEESEAQVIKDNILRELFRKTEEVQSNQPGAFLLKFSDCKFVKPGWVSINCETKETYNWLLSWKIPDVGSKALKATPALDSAPLQSVKFSLKTKWVPDVETMLKLIELQNREISTKRWVLEEKKNCGNGMEQFTFKVDCGTVQSFEKMNWSFFYELFAVKIIEYNGKVPGSILSKEKILTTVNS